MAIRNVVTRGFGPGASIAFVTTRGYSIGAAVTLGPILSYTKSLDESNVRHFRQDVRNNVLRPKR